MGSSTAIAAPTYGMNRRAAARTPQSAAYGNAQQEERDAQREPEAPIDDGLHQQVPGDASRRLVERPRRHGDAPIAHQPDQPIAQILPLEQHEDHEHRHHTGGGEHVEQPRQPGQERRRRLDDDGNRLGGRGFGLVLLHLAHDLGQGALDLLDRPALAQTAQVRHALPDIGAVLGELVGEGHELAQEHPSDTARKAKGEEDDDEDGRRAPGPPSVYRVDHGAQQEREQSGERDRDQDALTPVETRHDERARRRCAMRGRISAVNNVPRR